MNQANHECNDSGRTESMSNIIRVKSAKPKEITLSMSNQGMDCFLELLLLSAADADMTPNQKDLIGFLRERYEINQNAPGTASFDVVEMPWNKETLKEDARFLMKIIGNAEKPEVYGELDYRPDMRIVAPWLRRFGQMIYGLDEDYVYGTEEVEIIKGGLASIYRVLKGNDAGAKRRLLFYLDRYLDPYYQNDLSSLYEPLKEMLQDVVIRENEDDVREEALHLLEAYTEAPYDIFEENINAVPEKFLSEVKSLIKTGEPERIE